MANPSLVYTLVDNNGQEAQTRLYLSDALSVGEVQSFALALAAAISGVSDAVIVDVRITWLTPVESASPPAPTSDVDFAAVLFYRNGDDTSSFRLPAARRVLAETDGAYAGVRITRASSDLLGLLSILDNLLAGTLDPLGRPFGTVFSVGGYDRL